MISLIDIITESSKETDKYRIIADLQAKLKRAEDRLEYETNKYEKQLQGLKTDLISKFQKDMQMELDGMTAIANRLKSEDSVSLSMYIANIKQLLQTYK